MKNLALHWKIIIGLVLGIIWAISSSYLGWSEFTLNWIDPWGKIFINLLKMIAVPIVLFSLIKGVSELADISKLGKLGFKTLGIYVVTTVIAVSLGLAIVNIVKPGDSLSEKQKIENRIQYEIWCADTGTEILDSKDYLHNPKYNAYIDKAQTKYNTTKLELSSDKDWEKRKNNMSKQTTTRPLQFLVDVVPTNIFHALTDLKLMLQIIFFAAFFGAI